MGCSNCYNSNCTGCGDECVSSAPSTAAPTYTVRSCSPLAGCGSVTPSTPTPYYNQSLQCQENHCQEIINNYFSAAICSSYAFNMPECDAIAQVYFSNVKTLPVGAYLWAASVGFLEVLSFNYQTGQATLKNNCQSPNVEPGTSIPACTCFVVSVVPETPVVSSVSDSETSPFASGSIDSLGNTISTAIISLSFANITNKVMNLSIEVIVNSQLNNLSTPSEVKIYILRQINGGGFGQISARYTTYVAAGLFEEQLVYSYVTTLAAGGTLLVDFKGAVENAGGATLLTVAGISITGNGLGVAL